MGEADIDDIYPLLEHEDHVAAQRFAGFLGTVPASVLERAQGCLLGQLAGDSLGSLVEFQDVGTIRNAYPGGVRDLAPGGTFGTLAGQPTDDSEMALMLARSIVRVGAYDAGEAAVAYARWCGSGPFDIGRTTHHALAPALSALRRGAEPTAVAQAARQAASTSSQANGALMRVSPLAIFAHVLPAHQAAGLAREDCRLTHPHPICCDADAIFVVAIGRAIARGGDAAATYQAACSWARAAGVDPQVLEWLERAATKAPEDFHMQMGWVRIALQNAFWQLLHAPDPEAGIVDTVMRGGDTDTNAAIAGALLGAVHGRSAIPLRWVEALQACRPEAGRPGVRHPRPRAFWPVDALALAARLAKLGALAATAAGGASGPPPT